MISILLTDVNRLNFFEVARAKARGTISSACRASPLTMVKYSAVFSEKEVGPIFEIWQYWYQIGIKFSVENSLQHELHIKLWERCCMKFQGSKYQLRKIMLSFVQIISEKRT